MAVECAGCGRHHDGEMPANWNTILFEMETGQKVAVIGNARITQRVCVVPYCFCCEPIRQRLIKILDSAGFLPPARPTR